MYQSRFDQEAELLCMGFVTGVRPVCTYGSWWCSLLSAVHPILGSRDGAVGSARPKSEGASWVWLRAGADSDELEPHKISRSLQDQIGPTPVSPTGGPNAAEAGRSWGLHTEMHTHLL